MALDAIEYPCHPFPMKARLVIRDRRIFDDGSLIDMVIWLVPEPVPPTSHGLKYRLCYGRAGRRLVGCDNERGKGDHRHYEDVEEPYVFVSLERLLDDFEADVVRMRGAPI